MKHEKSRIALLAMVTALVALVVLLFFGLYLIYSQDPMETSFIVRPGLIYISYIGLIALFLVAISINYELAMVDSDPGKALADLAHRLRASRFRVKEDKNGLKVQVSSSTAIRLVASRCREGTVIRYKLDQTPSGWAAMIILLFLYYLAIIAVAMAVYAVWQVQRFAQKTVLPRLEQAEPFPEDSPTDMIRHALIDGLSEGYRLSSEAYEAQCSNYQDGILAVIIGGILVWLASLISFLILMEGQTLGEYLTGPLVGSTIVALLFTLPPMIYLIRKVKVKAAEIRIWSDRLLAKLQQETDAEAPKDDETSAFELLSEASKEIPKWMKVMRRAGMFTDPWTWFAIFVLAYASFQLFLMGIYSWYTDSLALQAGLIAGGFVSAICCYFLYRRWVTRAREEEEATTSSWEVRLRTVRENMQRHLEGL